MKSVNYARFTFTNKQNMFGQLFFCSSGQLKQIISELASSRNNIGALKPFTVVTSLYNSSNKKPVARLLKTVFLKVSSLNASLLKYMLNSECSAPVSRKIEAEIYQIKHNNSVATFGQNRSSVSLYLHPHSVWYKPCSQS